MRIHNLKLLLVLVGVLFCKPVLGQSVKLSSLEFTDHTVALKAALTSDKDTIIIDFINEPWKIGPLRVTGIHNKVLLFEPGAELRAKRGVFKNTSDALLTFIDCSDMQLLGNETELQMLKEEYVDGEWRHGLSLRGVKNFKIIGLNISNTGGDGIYIAGSKKQPYSENIYIENIKSLHNKRQGISIISAKNLSLNNCLFAETKGTLPGAGLDIEPNTSKDVIQNIRIENCVFENNYGAGIVVGLRKLTGSSKEISIRFENCVTRNNHALENQKVAAEIIIGANSEDPVKGNLSFKQLLVENSNWGMLYTRKRSAAFQVSFIDCAIKNIGQQKRYSIVYFEVPDYYQALGNLGGMSFQNLSIENQEKNDFLVVRGSRLGTLKRFENFEAQIVHKGLSELPVKYINYDGKNNKNVFIHATQMAQHD